MAQKSKKRQKTADMKSLEIVMGTIADHRIGLEELRDSNRRLYNQLLEAKEAGLRSGCFIATAAFGNPMAKELKTLRKFRDTVLLRSSIGSAIVTVYYKVSPPIAMCIENNEQLRRLMRLLLNPVIKTCKFFGCDSR